MSDIELRHLIDDYRTVTSKIRACMANADAADGLRDQLIAAGIDPEQALKSNDDE